MFTNKNIINIEIDEITYTAIVFDQNNTDLPASLLVGEKQPGYLYKDDELIPWYWTNFYTYNGSKCVYFDKINLYPVAELATSLRSKAPLLINNLAKALSKCSNKFLDLRGGVVSAWRIYFTETNDVLILSSNLADIFASTNSEATRYNNTSSLIHSSIHPAFTLIDEMAQLYYFAATGIKPFEKEYIREVGYRAIPLGLVASVVAPELEKDTIEKVDGILHLSMGKQREISGNQSPQAALVWFYSRFENIEWNLSNQETLTDTYELLKENNASNEFLKSLDKRAKQKIFWRKKGTVIIVLTVCIFIAGAFIKERVDSYLAPPYTAEMDQSGVINSYYEAQNDLNVENLEDSLAKGVKSPIANEVTTLFVTKQTRQAYESKNTVTNPVTWEDEGRPAIPYGNMIYGIDDVKIQDIGNNMFKVTSTFYSPDSYSEFSEDNSQTTEIIVKDYSLTYRFEQVQVFTVELSKKGWYEITDIKTISVKYKDTLKVPTIIDKSTDMLSQQSSTDETTDSVLDTRVTTEYVDNRLVNLSK